MNLCLLIVLSFTVFVSAKLCLSDCEVSVKIDSGFICGRLRPDDAGNDYASFRGIPYAKPPLGDLRFEELQPVEPFKDVFNATEDGPICVQGLGIYASLLGENPDMSEDCLTINVHVPAKALRQCRKGKCRKLPIFIYNYGGSFAHGTGSSDVYGPEYLMTKDIIVATFNYRISVPGFLSLPSCNIPGNNGLRDAVTALRWIKRNAKAFGGDPKEITLGGQSSGGASTHLLSLSPVARKEKLFKRVMSFSGTAAGNFYTYSPKFAKKATDQFLKSIDIDPSEDPDKIKRKLIDMPIEKLVEALETQQQSGVELQFGPVVEIPNSNFTTILPKDPEILMMEGAGNAFPLLVGSASAECQLFRNDIINNEEKLKSAPPALLVPRNLAYKVDGDPTIMTTLSSKFLDKYFNGTLKTATSSEYLSYCSDTYFVYPALRTAEQRLHTGSAPTFSYNFGYSDRQSVIRTILKADYQGVSHMEEIFYFFRPNQFLGPSKGNELQQSSTYSAMKDWMTTIIANFVKGKTIWRPISNGTLLVQQLNYPFTYDLQPSNFDIKFYDDVYSTVGY